jgi:hypothetical protein
MKRLIVILILVVLAGICLSTVRLEAKKGRELPHGQEAIKTPEVKSSTLGGIQGPVFGNIPLYFIPNKGQVNGMVRFYARASRYTLWMTEKGLVFEHSPNAEAREVCRLAFVGANAHPAMAPVEMTDYMVNYLKGNDQSGWQTGMRTSKAVLYKNLYPGIDLKVYGSERQVEYDWLVKPGAAPGAIGFRYEHARSVNLDAEGNLVIKTQSGGFIHKRPAAHQSINGKKAAVAVDFKAIDAHTYGFQVGPYDKGRELVIDPVVLGYSSYLGGSDVDRGFALAVDASGCAYVTGETQSSDFPTDDAYQSTFNNDHDVFITKFNASGSDVVYSTYLGGSGSDMGEGIQVDNSGRAYVTGHTDSSDFPTQNPYQATYAGGGRDVFVSILSANGRGLEYSTYLGGSQEEKAFALALDSSKNIYLTGYTTSSNFPTHGAYQDALNGGHDAFITKISSSGSSLSYSTLLGGNGQDTAYGIALGNGSAYITGRTGSSNFPRQNEYQSSFGGGTHDAFVTKFSSSGGSLIYSTYLGGSQNDSGWGIDVDDSGGAHVVGDTYSSDFPTENAYQDTLEGGSDAFVTKFSSSGVTLEYSTYLGGQENDSASHVTVNSTGYASLTGNTYSSDFPVKRAYQSSYNGDLDAFAAMFTPDGGSLSFSTFLGGSDSDTGRGIVVDSNGDMYISGFSYSSDFPTKNAFQNSLDGDVDAFVSKFSTSLFGTLCGGVDNCDLTWTTGGSADWFEQTAIAYYDDDAAQSGNIGDSESSYLQTVVTGPGELSFWWKISSSYSDYLKFYIDNVYKSAISGYYSSGWTQQTYSIAAGTHTLKWSYEKNASYYYGQDCGWVDKVVYTPEQAIVLNRDSLTFGAVQGSTASGDQTFSIGSSSSGALNWTAAADKGWLSCTPTSGSGDGVVTVSVDVTGLTPGTYTGSISVSATNATNSPQTVSVALTVYTPGQTSAPFGNYATPTNNSTIRSSVPFTGWVLDDLGVQSVKIYRQSGASMIYIGDAVFVEGARPDVEAAYPSYPDNYKAGWGYMMLTNFLPDGGNSTYNIVAIATDVEGHKVSLGTKTVHIDNASAVKPFGAIDTPGQGGTASGGSFINWGWVLTPQPNSIPTDGSTIDIWVDGVNIGHPHYNNYRSDIATLFPGYANTNGAVGYYYLDTTAYENGVHTIQWTARDSGGNSDGIGSRYFSIQNSGGSSRAAAHGMPRMTIDYTIEPDTSSPVGILKGYEKNVNPANLEKIYPDDRGCLEVEIRELERVELHFGGSREISGWQVVGDQYRPLPIGSFLDRDKGIFYWQTAVGFCGKYRLIFIHTDENGCREATGISIDIAPRY